MQQNVREIPTGMGKLPAAAPLANPFVPFQADNPEQYEAKLGLVRGTLYPGLDLPFMGMVNKGPFPSLPWRNYRPWALRFRSWHCTWTPIGTMWKPWSCTAAINKCSGRDGRNMSAPMGH